MDLAPEGCHLVSEHDELDGEVRVTAIDESDEPEDAAERRWRSDRVIAGCGPNLNQAVKVLSAGGGWRSRHRHPVPGMVSTSDDRQWLRTYVDMV